MKKSKRKNDGQPGWFKASRGDDGLELIRGSRNAFVLLYVIAHRARWREGFNVQGLNPGEALIGDYKRYGMTRRQYRTALDHLVKWHFVSIKTMPKGTIATLSNTTVFDINSERTVDEQKATSQKTANSQLQKKPVNTGVSELVARQVGQHPANTRPTVGQHPATN